MKYFLFLQFFLILTCGYAYGQNTTKDKPFTITLNTNLSNSKEIGLKEIAENIEYIKLEFLPESVLGRIQRLVATEKYFFVFDNRDISQFSRSGKYIRKIGKSGRGPGEYPALRDFAVDESTQHLFVLGNFIRQIFVYDFNGNYVKGIKLNEEERETIDITEDGLIVLQTSPITKSLLSTEVINQQGISVLKFYSRSYLNSNSIKIAKTPNTSYIFNNNVLFKEGVNDTIYKISSKRITPYFTHSLGKYQPPVNYPYEERAKYIEIYKICESDKYIITFFFNKGLIGTAVYNKTTNETTVNMPEDKIKRGVKNDIDNGINFFMATVPFTLKTNQKEWLQILEPNLLNDYKNDNRILDNFKTIIDNFNDGDNPVIMVIRLK
jgi:hypothetical protein